jgi:hypothetical protein
MGRTASDPGFFESRRRCRAAPSVARRLAGWQIQSSKLVGAQAARRYRWWRPPTCGSATIRCPSPGLVLRENTQLSRAVGTRAGQQKISESRCSPQGLVSAAGEELVDAPRSLALYRRGDVAVGVEHHRDPGCLSCSWTTLGRTISDGDGVRLLGRRNGSRCFPYAFPRWSASSGERPLVALPRWPDPGRASPRVVVSSLSDGRPGTSAVESIRGAGRASPG